MTWLVTGLILFLGMHSFTMARGPRTALVERVGYDPYRGVYSLIALAGLVLIVIGFGRAPLEPIYAAPAWGRTLALVLMPVSLVLIVAGNVPCNIRRALKNPMLIGTLLWALVHLLANGELRSLVLFGAFALWAAADLISLARRADAPPRIGPQPWWRDLLVVVIGLAATALLARYHGSLFGMPVLY